MQVRFKCCANATAPFDIADGMLDNILYRAWQGIVNMKISRRNAPEGALTVADAAAVSSAVESALSSNTRRAYAAGWRAWQDFAATRGWAPMPPTPEQVAAWCAAMSESGLSPPSVRCRLAALAFACRVAPVALRPEHPPTGAELVRQMLRGIVRQRNHRPRQSAPVTPDICAAAAVKTRPEDAALLALLHDAGLRVSEAANLESPDVECEDDDGTVTVRGGKTGARIVAVSARAVRALSAIRSANAQGSVFGVTESQLRRRVKSAAKAIGTEGVTSHGGRVGMAQTMARNGAAAPAIMRQGGWQSSAMVARYTRKLAAKEAVRFL